MDSGAWRATVHGVAELDMTEETEHACTAESVQPGFLILMSDGAPHSRC